MKEIMGKSVKEFVQRQKLLESEMDANEEENRRHQAELDLIYAEQDRRRN